MKRFKNWRRRTAALALLPVTALLITFPTAAGGAEGPGVQASSLDSSSKRVPVGATVKLSGRFAPRKQGTPTTTAGALAPQSEPAPSEPAAARFVRIEFRAAGSDEWRKARLVKADRKGRFARAVRVRRSGSFRAVSSDGRSTEPTRVRAKARIRARASGKAVKLGDRVAIKGTVVPGGGRQVLVKVGDQVLTTRSGRSGGFKVNWEADRTGTEQVRVKTRGDKVAAGAGAKVSKVTVLRPALASWYGPGLYGNRTACGQTLTTTIVGVAHKSLPCGTKLTINHGDRTIRTEVIDRGPYSGDREFDLTSAARDKLGFASVGTTWVSK